MAKEVERGKHISVLVEQAFPTCILVSYEDEGKTFRGVLLHETSHTVTRASISKAVDNNESSSNLCLTAARAVTCESSEPQMPASRVSTRSSTMLSQDEGNNTANVITPVHKIRGLVKKLSPRKRRASSTVNDTPRPTEPQSEIIKSPQQKNSLMKSLKRKRANSNPSTSPKVRKVKNEEVAEPLANSKIPRNLSPLFPVLKLKRTAGTTNNYVAVSLHSENNSNLNEQNNVKANHESSGTDSTSHKHNTRLKGRKQTGHNELESKKKPCGKNQEEVSLSNGESLVEVYTERTTSMPSMLDEETKGKVLNKGANQAYAKRGLQPRSNNQEMRVGDIVWGKVHGHPWWPGRILGILCNSSESDAGFVKVAWYGSTTTSEISCGFLAMFQENFKQLFKKQKTGAYRRAVREAQQDIQVMSLDEQGSLV